MNPTQRKYTVQKRVSGVAKVYRKWAEWSVGDIIIGKWVDVHVDKYNKKDCPVIEVEEAFMKDTAFAKKVVGTNLVLNSTGMLEKAFKTLKQGDIVQVEYQGKSTIETGPYAGKESHVTQVSLLAKEEKEEIESEEDYV